MTLLRVLHAETLKMKRTIALKMVVVAPAVVALLILFIASQSPFSTLHRPGERTGWAQLTRLNLRIWALLMLPLYMTLESALVAGLDHSENHWKSLLARPVPRWTLYMGKLIVVFALTAMATLTLVLGILVDGAILPRLQHEVAFGFPVPWAGIFRDGALEVGLVFLALTMQHWVSLRWRSFSVAIGTGIVATVVGFFAVASSRGTDVWQQYFPWALPMLIQERQLHNIDAALVISCAVGLLVAMAGCWDFCRREVT